MKQLLLGVAAITLLGVLFAAPVEAQGVWGACTDTSSAVCADTTQANDIVKRIINLMLYAIGILAVIMIIHSGLKYTTSRGDAEQIKSAKNTLLYAVIGLIVAMLAFTIVNFVIGEFKDNAGTGPTGGGSDTVAPNGDR